MTDKNYQVLDVNGNEIKVVKSLSIAKKLANAEGGSVVCDGECVFKAEVKPEPTPEKYRIKVLMNIRAEPSLKSKQLGTVVPGTDVDVIALENDWLHLINDTFILYGSGEYAERLCRD